MAVVTEPTIAVIDVILITLSFPFYLYGAWIILRVDFVTWEVLVRHLKFIAVGLLLTTVPVVVIMVPRLFPLNSLITLHVFLGLQAYAMLAFGLTGIIRIYQVKQEYDLYHEPVVDVDLDDIHENMGAWRLRLRIGVFGYIVFWILAWIVGMIQYSLVYVTPYL